MDPHARLVPVFDLAPFVREMGYRLTGVGDGWVETELAVEEKHRQQHGFVHAGVTAALADHTAGGAASTKLEEGRSVLTSEYTIHLLRPASGDHLRCRAEVVRAGRLLVVVQADVHAGEHHVARYLGTMAVIDRPVG